MKWLYSLLLFLLYATASAQTGLPLSSSKTYFAVWNVGQGQWTTLITPTSCQHIDAGGEQTAFLHKDLKLLCEKKSNSIYLTHWDWDHISFARLIFKEFSKVCLAKPPAVQTNDRSKVSLLGSLKRCSDYELDRSIEDINDKNPLYGKMIKKRLANQSSQVFFLNSKNILIPGDSPTNQEKIWSYNSKIKPTLGLVS